MSGAAHQEAVLTTARNSTSPLPEGLHEAGLCFQKPFHLGGGGSASEHNLHLLNSSWPFPFSDPTACLHLWPTQGPQTHRTHKPLQLHGVTRWK